MQKKTTSVILVLAIIFSSITGMAINIDSEKSMREVYVHANNTQTGNSTTIYMGDDAKVYLAVDNPNKGGYDESLGDTDILRHFEPQYDMNGYIVKFYYDPEYFMLIDNGFGASGIDYTIPLIEANRSHQSDIDEQHPNDVDPNTLKSGFFVSSQGARTEVVDGIKYNTAYAVILFSGIWLPQSTSKDWYNLCALPLRPKKTGTTEVFIEENSTQENFSLELLAKNKTGYPVNFDFSAINAGHHTIIIRPKLRPSAPIADPKSGEYTDKCSVSLRTAEKDDCEIYYTLSEEPTDNDWFLYDGSPIDITADTTIRCYTKRISDGTVSNTAEYTYSIRPHMPKLFLSPNGIDAPETGSYSMPEQYSEYNPYRVYITTSEEYTTLPGEDEVYYIFLDSASSDEMKEGTAPYTGWVKLDNRQNYLDITETCNVQLVAYRRGKKSYTSFYYLGISPAPALANPTEAADGNPLTVQLKSDTRDADIYYTLDGSDPRVNGMPYNKDSDIYISQSCTLRTVAEYKGVYSEVYDYEYLINQKNNGAIEAHPMPGAYEDGTTVHLSSPFGQDIYYTTDGSDPADANNPNRQKYDIDNPPYITENTVVKAVTENEDGDTGDVYTFEYIDYDYLSFRTAKVGGESHAYVGVGRADTYYVQQVKKNKDSSEMVGGIVSADDVLTKTAAVTNVINDIVREAQKGETLRDKVELAHDGVINRIDYRYENECALDEDNNMTGNSTYIRTPYALVTHEGVCEAYSRSLQLVLNELGIPSVILHGTQISGTPEAHMWLAVQLPKEGADTDMAALESDPMNDSNYGWYVIDPTWDDPTGYDGYGKPMESDNGKGGGENRTYCLVGNDVVGANWILSGFFSSGAKEFTYPTIETSSYGAKTLLNNGDDGFQIETVDTNLEDVRATKWKIQYKGMSLKEAQDKGYYMMCKMYNYHADGTVSQFENWYYIMAGLIAVSSPYEDDVLTMPKGTPIFNDDAIREPKDDNWLNMVYANGEYIEFAVTTKAPPKWNSYYDVLMNGYFTGNEKDVLAQTGMLFNAAGSYEAPPYIKSQSPDVTRQTNNDVVSHAVVEFDDKLYVPSKNDANRDERIANKANNYEQADGQDFGITVNYVGIDSETKAQTPHVMSKNPEYTNFKVTYNCGAEKPLTPEITHNGASSTIKFGDDAYTHECNDAENCGIVKIEYDITPSNMWADDLCMYTFQFDGIVGRRSDKLANTWSWVFSEEWGYCWYRKSGIDWNLWGQPKLMDDVEDLDLSRMVTQGVDGEEGTLADLSDQMGVDNMNGRLVLVVEDLSNSNKEASALENAMLNDDDANGLTKEDIKSSSTYDIDFARTCRKTVVEPGQTLRMQVGFPAGVDSNSPVVFKAYHFTRCSEYEQANGLTCPNADKPGHKWNDDVLDVQEIPVAVTPYGLVILCDHFSPIEVVAVDENSPAAISAFASDNTNVVIESEGSGTVTYEKDGDYVTAVGENGMVNLIQGDSISFKAVPHEGSEVASVMVSGKAKDLTGVEPDEDGSLSFEVSAEEIDDTNALIAVTFETKKVAQTYAETGAEAAVAEVCSHPHENTKYFIYGEDGSEKITDGIDAKKDATCDTAGYTAGIMCEKCNSTISEPVTIAAKGHVMIDDVTDETEAKAATCTESGYIKAQVCATCGGNKQKGITTSPLGHAYLDYNTLIVNSAYVTNCQGGFKTAVCRNGCGIDNEKYVEGPSGTNVSHNYASKNYKYNNDATCTQDGTETAKCDYYGQKTIKVGTRVFNLPEDATICNSEHTRTKAGTATGHKKRDENGELVWDVNEEGICNQCHTAICSVENGGHKEVVDMEEVEATCTSTGKSGGKMCKACGAVIEAQTTTPQIAHSFDTTSDAQHEGEHHCTTCDEWIPVPKDDGSHTVAEYETVDATCTTKGLTGGTYCSVCQTIITPRQETPALGHKWNTDAPQWNWKADEKSMTATITFTCDTCQATESINVPADQIKTETIEEATCEQAGRAKYTASVEVNLPDDLNEETQTFKGENTTDEMTLPMLAHEYKTYEKVSDATCTLNATEKATCELCHKAEDVREIPDTATKVHVYEGQQAQTTKDATCTEEGYSEVACKYNCGTVRRDTIPAKGHDFTNGVNCANCGQASEARTYFDVTDVEGLIEVLNSADLDRGDTIYLANGEYDLTNISEDIKAKDVNSKITNGVMHLTQGITVTTAENKPADIMLASVNDVTIKGSVSIEASNVKLSGLTFDEPVAVVRADNGVEDDAELDTKACIVAGTDGGDIKDIVVTDCYYNAPAESDDELMFMSISGVDGAEISANTVENAGILVSGGNGETKTQRISMTNNEFKNFTLELTENAMEPGELIDFEGTVVRSLEGDVLSNPSDFVDGDPALLSSVISDLKMEVQFEQSSDNPKEVKVYLKGYTDNEDGSQTDAAIENLVAVDLEVKLTANDESPIAIDDFVPTENWTYTLEGESRYLIHEKGWKNTGEASNPKYDLNSTEGGKLYLGSFMITGSGSGVIKATVPEGVTSNVQQRSKTNNIVKSSTAAGTLDGTTISLEPTTRNLNVMIEFNNNIQEGNDSAYNDFTVTVTDIDGNEIVGKVGSAPADGEEDGVIYADDYTADKAMITFEGLAAPARYTVKISGAGYRTFKKDITISDTVKDDVSLVVWNNAESRTKTVIVGNDDQANMYDVTFLAGDIVNDYSINLYDLSAVVAYFGRTDMTVENSADYIKYDLNRDGKIDSKDVAYVLVSWDK